MPGLLVAVLASLAKAGFTTIADEIGAAITLWYCQRAQTQTLSAIADAAALAAHATTDEERYAAADAWQKALSRPRITPS